MIDRRRITTSRWPERQACASYDRGPSTRASRHAPAIAIAIAIAALLLAVSAGAQPNAADSVFATELFQRARGLMAQKKYAEACPLFEESQRLDPGGGTLLNLALCNVEIGKTATAWTQLNEAIAIAQRDGRDDREDLAKERVAALEPRLSRLVIEVPAEAALGDLVVLRDGSPVTRLSWGRAVPVDLGDHVIEVTAAGRVKWVRTVSVAGEGARERVVVPVLEIAPVEPVPAPAAAKPPPVGPPRPRQARIDEAEEPRGLPAQTWGGIAALSVGGASLTVGAVVGFVALAEYNALDCPNDLCDPSKADDVAAVNRMRGPSTAMLVVGTVGIATGVVLVATAPSRASARVSVAPDGLWIHGRF